MRIRRNFGSGERAREPDRNQESKGVRGAKGSGKQRDQENEGGQESQGDHG